MPHLSIWLLCLFATGATSSEINNVSVDSTTSEKNSGHDHHNHHIHHTDKIHTDHSKNQEFGGQKIDNTDTKNHVHSEENIGGKNPTILPNSASTKTSEKINTRDHDRHDHTNHADHGSKKGEIGTKVHGDHVHVHSHENHNNHHGGHHDHHSSKKSKFSFGDLFPNSARKFVDMIQPNAFPDDLVTDADFKNLKNVLKSLAKNANVPRRLFWYQIGFVIAAGAFCLLIFVFVLVFSCFVCCHRIDKSRRRQKSPRRKIIDDWDDYVNPCHRHWLNALLFLLISCILLCIYGTMTSARKSGAGVKNMTPTFNSAMDDFEKYANITCQDISRILVDNYKKFQDTFIDTVDSAYEKVSFDEFSKLGITNKDSKNTGPFMQDIETWFKNLSTINKRISNATETYQQLMVKVHYEREYLITELHCDNIESESDKSDCQEITFLVEQYSNAMESMSLKKEIKLLNDTMARLTYFDFTQTRERLIEEFDQLKIDIKDNSAQQQQEVEEGLRKIGGQLRNFSETFSYYTKAKMNASKYKEKMETYQPRMNKTSRYISMTGMTLAGLVAIIAIIFLIGFMISCCGKDPAYGSLKGCVRSKSSCWFSSGTCMAIFFLLLLGVICCAMFIAGGNVKILLCTDMAGKVKRSGLGKISERFFRVYSPNIKNHTIRYISGDPATLNDDTWKFDHILNDCLQNKTLFAIFNVSGMMDWKKINSFKNQVKEKSSDLLNSLKWERKNFSFVDSYLSQIEQFSDTLKTEIPANVFIDASERLKTAVTVLWARNDLEKMTNISQQVQNPKIRQLFDNFINQSEVLENQHLKILVNQCQEVLADLSGQLSAEKLPNFKSIGSRSIVDQALEDLTKTVNKTLDRLIDLTDRYLNDSLENFETDVTSCGPIVDVVNKIGHRACHCIIDNFNGIWFGLAWSLLLLIPTILVVTRLKGIYARSVRSDNSSNGTTNSHRCIVDAYSTVTDDYACYRRGSSSSYNRPIGHNVHVQKLQYPATSGTCISDTDQYLPLATKN